jgi:hypothetical protein
LTTNDMGCLTTSAFGTLMSLGPAIAMLIGPPRPRPETRPGTCCRHRLRGRRRHRCHPHRRPPHPGAPWTPPRRAVHHGELGVELNRQTAGTGMTVPTAGSVPPSWRTGPQRPSHRRPENGSTGARSPHERRTPARLLPGRRRRGSAPDRHRRAAPRGSGSDRARWRGEGCLNGRSLVPRTAPRPRVRRPT